MASQLLPPIILVSPTSSSGCVPANKQGQIPSSLLPWAHTEDVKKPCGSYGASPQVAHVWEAGTAGGHPREGGVMAKDGLHPWELCVTNMWKEAQRRDLVLSGTLHRGWAHFLLDF